MKLKQTKTLMRSWLLLFLLMFFPATLLAQNVKKVSGTVFDENGEALIGATITELASAKGVITDFDGNFSLDVTSGAKSIQVSYVGYKTKTVNFPVAGKLTIRMEPDIS